MSTSRRQFLSLLATTTVGCASAKQGSRTASKHGHLAALAFDAFVIFDPRGFFAELQRAFGEDGPRAAQAFRARLFDYGWLRVLAHRYEDFWLLSQHALDSTTREFRYDLKQTERARLLRLWSCLPPWPDAAARLPELHARGLRMAVLSNWSPHMLRTAIGASRLPLVALSTDARRTYKPSPAAYEIAVRRFALPKAQIGFVAFAGWDAAGANWFGYPTLWMNRAGAPREALDLEHVPSASSFDDPAFGRFASLD